MRHPTDGTLRRLLDEPDGVADTDREHVAACATCTAGLAGARRDAEFAAVALSVDLDPDVEAAWSRLSQQPSGVREKVVKKRKWRSPVIAGVAVAALLAGAGAAAAGDWFRVLRTERIAPVTVDQADLASLPDLSAWGELEITEPVRIRPAGGAEEAGRVSGLAVPEVAELPAGVSGQPTYQVGERAVATFTFSAAKAAGFAASAGQSLPPTPPGLDGSRYRLTAGPGLAAVWSSPGGVPDLMVARAVAPTAYANGNVPFTTARDYLLSLSGLPEEVAAQLRRFTGDGTTLPLHVLNEELTSRPAEVGGVPATVLTSRDELLAAVVWVRDGAVTVVAGSLTPDEVLDVARELRWPG